MLGNGRLRNVEAGRELGDAHFTLRETLEHSAARGIGQRAEDFRLDHRDVNISRYLYVLQLPPEKIAQDRACSRPAQHYPPPTTVPRGVGVLDSFHDCVAAWIVRDVSYEKDLVPWTFCGHSSLDDWCCTRMSRSVLSGPPARWICGRSGVTH
jgi:hypothetical protein